MMLSVCPPPLFSLRCAWGRAPLNLTPIFLLINQTGIPELKSAEDLEYLRYAFATDLDDNAAAARFTELIHAALDCWTTRFNNAIHLIAHGGKG